MSLPEKQINSLESLQSREAVSSARAQMEWQQRRNTWAGMIMEQENENLLEKMGVGHGSGPRLGATTA